MERLNYTAAQPRKRKGWKLWVIGLMVVIGLVAIAVAVVEIAQGQKNAAAAATAAVATQQNGTHTVENQSHDGAWKYPYPGIKL